MNKFILIYILAALAPFSVQAQNRCQNLIYSVDSELNFSFGRVNQNDTYFLEKNLITTDKSMLCGPTCAMNVITKLKKDYDISTKGNPKAEVGHIVQTLLPKKGIHTAEIVSNGVTLEDIKSVLDYKFNQLDIDTDIQIHSLFSVNNLSNITLNHLKSGLKKKNAVVLLLGVYKGLNLSTNYFPERLGGHFVVVVGKDLKNPNVIYIQDPSEPDLIKKLNLKSLKPASSLISTFELVNDDQSSLNGVQAIIDGYLSIQ